MYIRYIVIGFCMERRVVGVEAIGSSDCLVVFCWSPFGVEVLSSMCNCVFCKISANNGKTWFILFLYGAQSHQLCPPLWAQLSEVLSLYPDFLIISDINQLDNYADILGGATLIRGWEEFSNWKH